MTPSFRHRLKAPRDPRLAERATAAIEKEKSRHLLHHIDVNRAHATMLAEQHIIDQETGKRLLAALDDLAVSDPQLLRATGEEEDLFSVIEGELIRRLGIEVAGQLHTGRSRNDYYMTVARLGMKESLEELRHVLLGLVDSLVEQAATYKRLVFPGYTHNSQQAQPITFGHFLLAHADAFLRDIERVDACAARVNASPMGAAALGGTDFPLDRNRVAELLGFAGIVQNTQDAAGIRDFQIEASGVAVAALTNANRLAESLILYNTAEFGLIRLSDDLMGVSSIMPQKRNPVALEFVEVGLSKALGGYVSATTTLKSTTIGMSEEAASVDDIVLTVMDDAVHSLAILIGAIKGVKVDEVRVRELLHGGFLTVTQITDYLVSHGDLPFRTAHGVVALSITKMTEDGYTLADPHGIEKFIATIQHLYEETKGAPLTIPTEQLRKSLDPETAVLARATDGGPGVLSVEHMIEQRRARLDTLIHAEQR